MVNKCSRLVVLFVLLTLCCLPQSTEPRLFGGFRRGSADRFSHGFGKRSTRSEPQSHRQQQQHLTYNHPQSQHRSPCCRVVCVQDDAVCKAKRPTTLTWFRPRDSVPMTFDAISRYS